MTYYSKVYWHFTGSPEGINWHQIREPKDIKGKPKEAYKAKEILKEIIISEKLMANCTEKIFEGVTTDKFCCVCDIPLKDLICHSKFYGNVALGFTAERVHEKFNPVFYIDNNKLPISSDLSVDEDKEIDLDTQLNLEDTGLHLISCLFGEDNFAAMLNSTLGSTKSYIKITNFSTNDNKTLYREREWRCIGDFQFTIKDIEIILVPKVYIKDVQEFLYNKFGFNDVSIISWELLKQI